MAFFPLFVDLQGRRVLIVGGGKVALGKAKKLLDYGATLRVVAPEFVDELKCLAKTANLQLIERAFLDSDVSPDDALIVVAAADRALGERVACLARQRRVWVNVADAPDASSFYFPALLKRGNLSVGVSTSGASPTLAREIRDLYDDATPPDVDDILDRADDERRALLRQGADPSARRRAALTLWNRSLHSRLRRDDVSGASPEFASPAESERRCGRVAIIGAGAGPADLITLRGRDALRRCDAVLYDDLIDLAALDWAPECAERIHVGKRCGRASPRQDAINAKMIELARAGKFVVRLKGGDPFLFGRGGEEAQALAAAGIPYEIAPGVTSALYIPMEAGIPATHRGVSRNVHIFAAHTADEELFAEVDRVASLNGTLVFLMGLRALDRLVARLLARGKSPETPVAVLSGGCAPRRVFARGRLADIVGVSKKLGVAAPATIVVGNVAALDLRDPLRNQADEETLELKTK